MDDRIQQIIQREAVNVGLGTAISPYGFIDVIVALWRNLKLVRQVAEAYQGRPGLVGTFLVVRRALAAVALADLAHETSAMLVGAFRGLAFLSPIGQGLTNAALTVRLGLLVQAECRPLPMPPGKTRSAASLLLRSVPEQLRRLVRRREDKSNDAQPPADEAR
jgi:putative membrane protein